MMTKPPRIDAGRITPHSIKIKIWQDEKPIYKDKGDSEKVKNSILDFFKNKMR